MRKNLFLILAIAFATTMSAQFYAGLGVGYGLGASKRVLGHEVNGTTTTNLYGSFGQGLNIQPKLGYMFNENMGFELGVNYFMGSTQTLGKTTTSLTEGKSSGLILAPQFVLKTESGIYTRVGIFLPVMGKTIITSTDSDYMGSGAKMDMEMERQGSFSLGLIGAIGYSFAISEQMNFFVELQYSAMSMKSGTSKYTKLEVGGQDQLANMDTFDKETTYVDELTASSNTSSNPNYNKDAAKEALKETAPFSAIGINVGITFSF